VVPRHEYPLLAQDRDVIRRLYAGAVRQMDDFLGRVLDALAIEDQLDNTTLILTADHGEELLEHGHVGHASTSHHATLYEEVLRTPLLFIDSRITAPREVPARVYGGDLFPTLLRLAGEDPQLQRGSDAVDLSGLLFSSERASLPDALAGDRVLTFQSARMGYQTPRSHQGHLVTGYSDGRRKYILEQYGRTRRMLYDLTADPTEHAAITDGTEVEAAHSRLQAMLHPTHEGERGGRAGGDGSELY
jgi:arylsulfatase A-like enzyme